MFVGPDIRKLLCDPLFPDSMSQTEKNAWEAFAEVVHNFLGNRKTPNYKEVVGRMLTAFEAQGCNMSLFGLLSRKPWSLQRRAQRKVPSGYSDYGKTLSRKIACQHDG